MGIVCYLNAADGANAAMVAAIAAEEAPAQVVFRDPLLFQAPDADPLETVVYVMDADTAITAMCEAVEVTPLSIETFMEP